MTVKFSCVDNGARNHDRPFVQANVDGIRVRWSVNVGWSCAEHGEGVTLVCEHCDEVESHLSRRIFDRITHLTLIGAVRTGS